MRITLGSDDVIESMQLGPESGVGESLSMEKAFGPSVANSTFSTVKSICRSRSFHSWNERIDSGFNSFIH